MLAQRELAIVHGRGDLLPRIPALARPQVQIGGRICHDPSLRFSASERAREVGVEVPRLPALEAHVADDGGADDLRDGLEAERARQTCICLAHYAA